MARFDCGLLEVKFAAGDTKDGTFSGYGAVFGNVDDNGDVILKGAFKDAIATAKKTDAWPMMLLNHGMFFGQSGTPIGIWTGLDEDDKGLRVEGKLAVETQAGAEIYALLRMQPRPAISGLSIGFRPVDFTMGVKAGEARRTLKKVDLFEISLVTTPCNMRARIDDVKSSLTEREFESWLVRDAGFSAREAKTIISSGFKTLAGARDAAPGEDGPNEDGPGQDGQVDDGQTYDAEAVALALARFEQMLRA